MLYRGDWGRGEGGREFCRDKWGGMAEGAIWSVGGRGDSI